jgi:MoxR-like ATPase
MSRETVERLESEIQDRSGDLDELREQMSRVLVGQQDLRDGLLRALLCDGHVLIEGVPGIAKTLAARTLAACLDASFTRIQFTPDLLPADLTGTMVYQPDSGTFSTRKGPVFSQMILADEINRAPAKVQSALLEAMQERQVTIGGESHPLPRPFFVMATQNPIEQEGTYPLPEAQVDRFLLKLLVEYPTADQEKVILERMGGHDLPAAEPVLPPGKIIDLQLLADRVVVEDSLVDYMVRLVEATRYPASAGLGELEELISYGASPRATLALQAASRASALMAGQAYVVPEQVKAVAHEVLRHRIIRSFEAEAEEVGVEEIIDTVLDRVPVR